MSDYVIKGQTDSNEYNLIVIDESDWSVEVNESSMPNFTEDLGVYFTEVTNSKKLVFIKKSDGEIEAYGNVDPVLFWDEKTNNTFWRETSGTDLTWNGSAWTITNSTEEAETYSLMVCCSGTNDDWEQEYQPYYTKVIYSTSNPETNLSAVTFSATGHGSSSTSITQTDYNSNDAVLLTDFWNDKNSIYQIDFNVAAGQTLTVSGVYFSKLKFDQYICDGYSSVADAKAYATTMSGVYTNAFTSLEVKSLYYGAAKLSDVSDNELSVVINGNSPASAPRITVYSPSNEIVVGPLYNKEDDLTFNLTTSGSGDYIILVENTGDTCGVYAITTSGTEVVVSYKYLYGFGYNTYGLTGSGDSIFRSTPTQVGEDTDWELVDTGTNFSVFLKSDSTLWSCGINSSGELGLGDTTNRSTPTKIGSDTWKTFSCGSENTMAIKSDGTLWVWGNSCHTFGLVESDVSTPTQIGSDSDWRDVHAGVPSQFATKEDGTVYGFGHCLYLDLSIHYEPTYLETATYTEVKSGGDHILMLDDLAQLWCGGKNTYGQLGLGNTEDLYYENTMIGGETCAEWLKFSCNTYISAAIKSNGTLWSWGRNNYGQLGQNDLIDRSTPTQIGTDTDWNEILCLPYHMMAKKHNGEVWAWGRNNYGQLGQNDLISRSTPTQIGSSTDWYRLCGFHANTSVLISGKEDLSSYITQAMSNYTIGDPDGETSFVTIPTDGWKSFKYTSLNWTNERAFIECGVDWETDPCGLLEFFIVDNTGSFLTPRSKVYGFKSYNFDTPALPFYVIVHNTACTNNAVFTSILNGGM